MPRSPRLWLSIAGAWLLLASLGHGYQHVVSFVLEHGVQGQEDFAVRAMKAARSLEPLRPSLWNVFRTFSVGFGLLLFLAGAVDLLLARLDASPRILRAFAMLGTVFWTAAFVPFAFVDPVLQPIAVAAVAVPLHAIAWLTADRVVRESEAE